MTQSVYLFICLFCIYTREKTYRRTSLRRYLIVSKSLSNRLKKIKNKKLRFLSYNLSIVDHILAIRKNAYGTWRQIICIASEFHGVCDFGGVVGQESSTDMCSWLLIYPNLHK